MRKVFTIMVGTLAAAVTAQFFLAGRGAVTGSWDLHRAVGMLVVLLGLVTAAWTFASRVRGRQRTRMLLVAVLLLVMPVLAGVGTALTDTSPGSGGLVLGVHAVVGLTIAALLGSMVGRRGDRHDPRPSSRTADEPARR